MKNSQKAFMAIAALIGVSGAVAFTPKPMSFTNKVQVKLTSGTFTYQNRVIPGPGLCQTTTTAISCTFSSTKTAGFFTPALGYNTAYPVVNAIPSHGPLVNYPTDSKIYK